MSEEPFGKRHAPMYDRTVAERAAPEVLDPTVDVLADLAGDGRALEFAVGTGRVGLPLRARGVDVHGIELSTAMVEQLRAKPGGADFPVTIGDMASTRVDGSYQLVFLVFSTITNLLTQEEQVACFRNAAAHLDPGGVFLIETGLPKLQRLQPGERYIPFDVTPEHIGIDEYDVVNQRSTSHHRYVDGDRVTSVDSEHRWAYPAEYDLMAQLAGLEFSDRWSDWQRQPFTSDSDSHISVWRRPG